MHWTGAFLFSARGAGLTQTSCHALSQIFVFSVLLKRPELTIVGNSRPKTDVHFNSLEEKLLGGPVIFCPGKIISQVEKIV